MRSKSCVGGSLSRDWRLLEHVHEHRKHEGTRLPRSGLGDANHVLASEAERDAHHLHARRLLISRLANGGEDVVRQTRLGPVAKGHDALPRARVAHVALCGDLKVLSKDAPVAIGHVLDLLVIHGHRRRHFFSKDSNRWLG